MANLKEVRNRITSVTSTQQITKAMKMVSAAKLKRATNAIVQLRPYAEKLRDILGNVSASVESGASPYTVDRKPTRSEEHTSELQSLMRISYAVFCLKKKNRI